MDRLPHARGDENVGAFIDLCGKDIPCRVCGKAATWSGVRGFNCSECVDPIANPGVIGTSFWADSPPINHNPLLATLGRT